MDPIADHGLPTFSSSLPSLPLSSGQKRSRRAESVDRFLLARNCHRRVCGCLCGAGRFEVYDGPGCRCLYFFWCGGGGSKPAAVASGSDGSGHRGGRDGKSQQGDSGSLSEEGYQQDLLVVTCRDNNHDQDLKT
ncbi:hypothetical protein ZWY2020_015084 [Hordeum vulgare]|nr:hypothetical protein ZWY2020_015084 [Hordeum vulgare]